MGKRIIISEEEKKHIKGLYKINEEKNLNEGMWFEDLYDFIKDKGGKAIDFLKKVVDSDEGTDKESFIDKIKNLTSGERDELEKEVGYDKKTTKDQNSVDFKTSTKDQTPVNFKKVTKKIIEKLEGGYYNPKWHFNSRMGDSGETMFGIDRAHGGTLNTGKAGKEFWNLIDKNKSKSVWQHYYRGGSLENQLTDLAAEIMKPHYESLSNKYLTPEAKKIVNSSEPLLFHFIYASWNGNSFFKKFAEDINREVKSGNTSEEHLKNVALNSRENSAVSRSASKISKIFDELS